MKILNISFNNGIYKIEILLNKEDTKSVIIECKLVVSSSLNEILNQYNILSEDIKEAFWISKDEYLIFIPRSYTCVKEDTIIPLGTLRSYITTHMDGEEIFSLQILTTDIKIDACDLQFELGRYLNWDI